MMKKHKTYKIPGREGRLLAYIPDLQKIIAVPEKQASKIPEYVSSEDQVSFHRVNYPFPPRFDVIDLHLSNRCNMNCTYCYNEAKKHHHSLSRKLIDRSLDYILNHSRSNQVRVHFLGGEPVVSWALLKYTVDYALNQSRVLKKQVVFTMTSNGFWSRDQYDFIVSHFGCVTLSLDGPPEIHDLYRRFPNGEGSFNQVFESAKRLHGEQATEMRINATVTGETVNILPESVRFLCQTFPGITIFLEPVREENLEAVGPDLGSPGIGRFLSQYVKCLKVSDELGTGNRILTSFIRITDQLCDRFCGSSGANFIITPSGLVTSCGGATQEGFVGSDVFVYGKVVERGVSFSKDKYERLTRFDVSRVEACGRCFARYLCLGGCLSKKAFMKNFWTRPSPYCKEIKQGVAEYLWYLSGGSGRGSRAKV